jgi:drug/metabolite transporter (DMT)-like permease
MAVHTLVSSGTYLAAKGAMSEIAPLVFAFFRFNLSAVIFLGLMAARRSSFRFERSEWGLLFVLGLLAIPLNQCMFLIGLEYTQPTHPALLYATTPIWVYVLSALRGEEKITHGKTSGIIIALMGVIAFFVEKGVALRYDYLIGDSIIMIAVWAWAFYTVLGRPLVRKRGAMRVTSMSLMLGAAMYFPFGTYFALNFDYSGVGLAGWGGVAYTAVLTSVVAYTIWYWSIKQMEPSRVAAFINLQPVVTAAAAFFLIGERLSMGTIMSGIVILTGVYLAQRG